MSHRSYIVVIGMIIAAFTFTGSTHAKAPSASIPPAPQAAVATRWPPPSRPPVIFPAGTYPPTCPASLTCSPSVRPPAPAPPSSSSPLASPATVPSPPVPNSTSHSEWLAAPVSLGGRLNDSISPAIPLTDYNSPNCCSTSWAYHLGATVGQTSNAFSAQIYASIGWNPVPSSYALDDYHWIGGYDTSDGHFVQIGVATNNAPSPGNEFLLAWTDQANGAICLNGSTDSYQSNQGCTASLGTFHVTDQSWIQFWVWENNGTDVLYVNSTPFMERQATGVGNLDSMAISSEVATTQLYDMTTMIGNGLGLGGFFYQFSYWNGSSYVNLSPLTARSDQFDDGPGGSESYTGNYFTAGTYCGPTAYFGQAEPYGSGSGGYEAGTPSTQCVEDNTTLPGS
jgi:hypothetical protein